ncbi:MAG: hypothetical protein JXM79_05605 [Sedimentisphaerales bacterium]|nr:hypothetical protein [Sedimentisphaerales bacterium]
MKHTLKGTILAFTVTFLIGTLASGQEAPGKSVPIEADNRLGVVLDLERPSSTDILLLRNGDKLTGTVLNESFSIRTSYAQLKFNNRMIAGIDLEGGANNIESIITVNNNRFSGFIDDPVFVFKLQTGPQIEVRREKVLKAIFRVREAERQGIPQRQFLILKNGDYFSGRVLNNELTVSTTYAKVPIKLSNAESVTMIGENNPLTKIDQKNGDIIQGVLETEDIDCELDVGTTVKIYQDRIDVIYCQEGFIPNIAARVASGRALVLDSGQTNLDATWTTKGEMQTMTVAAGGKADRAGLKVGDVFETVDGQPLKGKSHFDQIRKEILEGKRPRAVFGIRRGDQRFTVVLVLLQK